MKGISRVLFLAVLAHIGHPSLSTSGAPLENPFPLGTIGKRVVCVVRAILGVAPSENRATCLPLFCLGLPPFRLFAGA